MTRAQEVHPAIIDFTVGYRPKAVSERAIKMWLTRKLAGQDPRRLRKWLAGEATRAQEALDDLKPIKTHPKVEKARRNALAHLLWATAAKKELTRQRPKARTRPVSVRRSRKRPVRTGLLSREAVNFASGKRGEEP